jgi:hypothetical protein
LDEAFTLVPPKSRHISDALKGGDYLSACEWIKARMDERWNPFLHRKFLEPAYQPNKTHELIFDLDAGVDVTPNFDKIFDSYVAERTSGTTIVKTYYDDDVSQLIRSGARLILKIHGTIDSPDRMIFSGVDYANARIKYASFYRLMDALLLTNTFLILGCGLSDPDFQLLFENFAYRFPSAPPHYMTYPDNAHAEFENLIRETRNLKFLRYSKMLDHQELSDSLTSLVAKVEARRQQLAASQTW